MQNVPYERPARRPLKILAFDPTLGRTAGNRATITVPYEPLLPGPVGERIEVLDFDGAQNPPAGIWYQPVDLDAKDVLVQGGLSPNESDPRFHQQMVYAVAMRVLENFDRALGRHFTFNRGRRLRVFPHAFHGPNAFYDDKMHALLFGYFRAGDEPGGTSLPGQTVFTCLSADVVAHETTHAAVHRLRPYFLERTNPDVGAFHEAFADIVAIFQHFTFRDTLREVLRTSRGALGLWEPLTGLAVQFGYATGSNGALRSALDVDRTKVPDPTRYQSVFEPHARGSILVAAVFDGFYTVYERRIRDLFRIATGGIGRMPDGDLPPDLVDRLVEELVQTAQTVLTMCIRAFDYLPPVDVTFGDFLRALVTADFELDRDDVTLRRQAMIDAFRRRGLYPVGVVSLAEESLLLDPPSPALPPIPMDAVRELLGAETALLAARNQGAIGVSVQQELGEEVDDLRSEFAEKLQRYATEHASLLHLSPNLGSIQAKSFHPSFRVGRDGAPVVELVATIVQRWSGSASNSTGDSTLAGLPYRGGTTIVAAGDGRVRYVAAKPLGGDDEAGVVAMGTRPPPFRLAAQRAYVEQLDAVDPRMPFLDAESFAQRMALRSRFSAMHDGIGL